MIYVFDECMGKRLPQILSMLGCSAEHLFDRVAPMGTADTEWMNRLDPAVHAVVTADASAFDGRRSTAFTPPVPK